VTNSAIGLTATAADVVAANATAATTPVAVAARSIVGNTSAQIDPPTLLDETASTITSHLGGLLGNQASSLIGASAFGAIRDAASAWGGSAAIGAVFSSRAINDDITSLASVNGVSSITLVATAIVHTLVPLAPLGDLTATSASLFSASSIRDWFGDLPTPS